jgi:hypothetical protein
MLFTRGLDSFSTVNTKDEPLSELHVHLSGNGMMTLYRDTRGLQYSLSTIHKANFSSILLKLEKDNDSENTAK